MGPLTRAVQQTLLALASNTNKLLKTPTALGLLVTNPDGRLLATPAANGWTLPLIHTTIDTARPQAISELAQQVTGARAHPRRRVGRHEHPRGNVDWWLLEAEQNQANSKYSWVERHRIRPEGPAGHGADQLLAHYQRLVLDSHAPKLNEQRTIIGGCEIAFTDTGQGPPLLLIHGLGSDRHAFRWNIPAWTHKRRIIALDLPGHGQSDKPAMTYSIRLLAEVTRRFLDQRRIQSFDLLGYSMGGAVACQLAVLIPERIRKLALLAPAGLQGELSQRKKLRSVARLLRNPFYPAIRDRLFIRRFPTFYKRFTAEVDLLFHETLALSKHLDFEQHIRAVADCINSLVDFPARNIYPKIKAPTLILFGEDDAIIPFEHGYTIQRAIPDARARLLPNCGHLLVVEARDKINQLLLDFLDEHQQQHDTAQTPA